MEFITTKEAAEKWEMSEQAVRRFCRNGKIPGAIQDGATWLVPEKARRPRKSENIGIDTSRLHPLAKRLVKQKTKKIYHGLYDYVQINLTYSSSRMASNRLTRNQVETIFKKGKVYVGFEPMKVSDVIEVLNHKVCIDYILDHIDSRNCIYDCSSIDIGETESLENWDIGAVCPFDRFAFFNLDTS